ncbi:MAG TPA: LLM class flavin-dependent oxidoreductase [Actinomycetota bacterium]|jgi:alkanesulfonate monooxygenase SsuD/methylene tetrahydromethanopterin reductase-like flavin-dependent oxidoreductase (luciferase family)
MTIPGGQGSGEDENTASGRTGIVLRDPLPWHDLVEVVEAAEDTGYEAVFVPEIAGREAFSTLTGFAMTTSRLALGTGVVTIPSRSPATTAMAAATIQDLSGGRMILGVGTGDTKAMARMPAGGVLELTRRYVGLIKQALSGDAVRPEELFGVGGFRLGLSSPADPPPVWLGALGDRMIRLAGEVADGVLLNWCTPERVARARHLMGEGARRAGRDPAALTVAVYVRACLGLEEPVALEALREMTGLYASFPHYRRQFELMGLGEGASMAAKAFAGGRPREIPESFVRTLTVVGGRAEALARFTAFRKAGADVVLCYPVAALEPLSSVLGTVLAAAPSPALER